jgi:transcriptional regulator with XRE-family HTH domain
MENDFRKNLRDELDYFDLTVKELSVKTTIPKGTLDSYLGDRASMPPADIAVKIAQVLGVSVEYLVTGQENQREKSPLSPELDALVQTIRQLNENDRKMLYGIAALFKNNRKSRG